ncbi:hypothetical protein PR202_ga30610 [Eleusine coracana subsp. coracana]|uniref:Uncharacterized protein n=1 Tax=Eleusine coracana subsp. coracana TaxID=191504 RepID=A0AAV5DR19_ELECO|nr:hypothetical protein PR202_ga30610 [Eleusine coracana subsp. coracana]
MATRPASWSGRPRSPATAVWFLPAAALLLIVLLLRWPRMDSTPRGAASVPARRAELYTKMARDLDERGAVFLKGGETSQSLTLSDLFDTADGAVVPKLKVPDFFFRPDMLLTLHAMVLLKYGLMLLARLPIRQCALTFSTWTQNSPLLFREKSLKEVYLPYFDQAEVEAVKRVTETVCPLRIVLDRVVLTSTGVLLGLWQVESGTDPTEIRSRLREALPRAPQKQLYDPVLLHTSFARILGHPKLPKEQSASSFDHAKFFHDLVAQVNGKIRGFQATVSELWYVEEYDVLH